MSGGQGRDGRGGEARGVNALDDDDSPSGPSPFETMGGEPVVLALVQRFYDLMDLEPDYKGIRALHPPHLEGSRDKLFWFLCGWLGGPQHYVERFGHPLLRARPCRIPSASPSAINGWLA